MPVYNTEKYVWEAIESILAQGFWDFECIIIDDASNDRSYEICEAYAQKDKRIKLLRNKKNIWVVKTRNLLLKKVSPKAKYIALLDADDMMREDRLEQQYNFLEQNKTISVLGSNISIIDQAGREIWERKYPKDSGEVEKTIFQKSPLAQPAVMIRKVDLDTLWEYDESYERAQDYDLWCRFYDAWYMISNIQEPLTAYRISPQQGKNTHLKLTLRNTIRVQKKYIFQKKYFSLKNLMYFFVENMLYLFPNAFILWVFKKINYIDEK